MKGIAGKAWGIAMRGVPGNREEKVKVLYLIAYLFFVVSASTVGRTAADTLFLSRYDAAMLSRMYLPQAAALILAGFAFQKFGGRIRMDRLIVAMIPAVSALVLLSRAGVAYGSDWVLPTIYVVYDLFNFLMIVCFWQFATSMLDQRKAKQTIGWVGSGGIVGGIVSGFGLKLAVPLIGTANLIYVYAGLQLLALAAVLALIRLCPNPAETFASAPPKTQPGTKKRMEGEGAGNSGLFRSVPHLKYVAVMSAALTISLMFVDFQFKSILRNTLQNDQLAGFMGSFLGIAGLLALFVQLFVAGKLLTRFGVMTAILIFPAALFAGSLGVLIMPALAMAVVVKGSDKVLGDTINSSVNQLVMFPVPPEWRNRAKSFLDGIVRNGAKGAAAVSLIVLSPLLSVRQFSYVILLLLVLGMAAAIKVKGAYLKTLLSTLQKPGSRLSETEIDFMDPASLNMLAEALRSPDEHQVLYAWRILKGMNGFDLTAYLPDLLRHKSPEVAAEALRHIEEATPPALEAMLPPLLANAEPQVKAHALTALAAYAKDEHLDVITSYLDDEDIETKSGAIAGLIKHYGIEGMFRAVGTLKPLIESMDARERTAMASLFGRIGIRTFYKPLVPMLSDTSADVRRCAVLSAKALQVPELVPFLVPLLQSSETRRQAVEALAAYGEHTVIPLLEPYFSKADAPMHLPKVFEKIGTAGACQKLLSLYPSSGAEMREKLLEALAGLKANIRPGDRKQVESYIMLESESYGQFAHALAELRGHSSHADVADAAGQLQSAVVRRMFRLLGLIHDARTIEAVYANWSEGDARQQANAAEVMDQLLQGELRLEIAKIMAGFGANAAGPAKSQQVGRLESQLRWLLELGDPWLGKVIQHASATASGEVHDGAGPDKWLSDHMERITALSRFPLFRDLARRDLSAIAGELMPLSVPGGNVIFRKNDPGDSLYLIQSGAVGVYREGVKLDERRPGDSFGQTAILARRMRTADIVAEEDCVLWRLDSGAFFELMFDRTHIALEMMKSLSRRLRAALAQNAQEQPAPGDRIQAAANAATLAYEESAAATEEPGSPDMTLLRRVLVLQKIDLFKHLSEHDFIALAQLVEETEYEAGEAVCRVDEYGDALYGIIRGKVRVHRGEDTFAVLGEGDYFGEMAIIDSGPRSADCTAVDSTVLLQLHRDQVISFCFQNIDVLKSMMQVLAERLRGMA